MYIFTKRYIFVRRKRIFTVFRNNVIFNKISVFGIKKKKNTLLLIQDCYEEYYDHFSPEHTSTYDLNHIEFVRMPNMYEFFIGSLSSSVNHTDLPVVNKTNSATPVRGKPIIFHRRKHKHTRVCLCILFKRFIFENVENLKRRAIPMYRQMHRFGSSRLNTLFRLAVLV